MANFALEITDPQVLSLAARQVPYPTGVLQDWLPPVTRRDHRYRFFRGDRSSTRATPVRPWNTPAVPLERGETEEVTGRMLPMSNIMWLLEDESQLLDVARASGDAERINQIFGRDMIRQTRAILQRVLLMQAEAVTEGKVTFGTHTAPENGLQLGSQEFGLDPAETAPILWDDSNPDILGQIYDRMADYQERTGDEVAPGAMIWSRRIFNVALKDQQIRAVFTSTGGTPGSVSPAQLNQVLSDRGLPPIIIDDTAVPNVLGVRQRLIPDHRVVFLPPRGRPIGQTQWGITEESKKLNRAQALSAENMPGLVVVPMESENPVHTGTLVSGIAMPVITEPDLVTNVNVLEPAS